MNKILIVGGAGYIGGYLTSLLAQYSHDITVYDNLVFENHYMKNIPFIYGDIRDREKLLKILPDYKTVIWLAAIVGDGACAVDPFLTQSINEDCVKWLVNNYHGKIVFTSTCSVYGINNELIDETATPNPISTYALTKFAAEQYIVNNAKDYLVFRLGTLFGLGDEHSRSRLDLVANVLAMRAAKNIPLTVFGGEQWRPLLHVKDVATAISYSFGKSITGLYNLSMGNYVIKDIAEEVKRAVPEAEIKYQDISFEDLRNYRVKNDKFKATGWTPNHTLEEGISEMVRVVRERRIKDVNNPIYSNVGFLIDNYRPL